MLPESVKREVYTFLSAVDLQVSSQLERFRALDEDGLSNVLLQCLDGDLQQVPEGLREERVRFDEAIAAINDNEAFDPPFELTLTHERFTKAFEGAVMQSDLLLQLDYVDPANTSKSWTAIYLVQAKLPPSGYPGEPNLDADIEFDDEQGQRIERLQRKIGRLALKYCFYCRPQVLPRDDASQVIARLRQRCGDVEPVVRANMAAGVWLAGTPHPTVRDLLGDVEEGSFCLARFIVGHFDDREDGENLANEIARYGTDDEDPGFLFLRRLCARDRNALEEIWQLIGGRRVTSPGYTLRHLRVTVRGPTPRPNPHLSTGP